MGNKVVESDGVTMRIALINLEWKLGVLKENKNLALEKLRLWHEMKGDEIVDYLPIIDHTIDRFYCASIFNWTPKETVQPHWVCGGTGFDVSIKLPPEINQLRPKVNYGFFTRGCIRNCKFCVVPIKEGRTRVEADLYDMWDGSTREVVAMDNNILSLPDHFFHVSEQIIKEKVKIDFNQGLDARLLTSDIATQLAKMRHIEYRFAYDHDALESTVSNAVTMLQDAGIKRCMWYVLVGFNSTFQHELYRLNVLRSLNQNAYVMRYKSINGDVLSIPEHIRKAYVALARWGNQRHLFQGMTFEQFLQDESNKRYRLPVLMAMEQ